MSVAFVGACAEGRVNNAMSWVGGGRRLQQYFGGGQGRALPLRNPMHSPELRSPPRAFAYTLQVRVAALHVVGLLYSKASRLGFAGAVCDACHRRVFWGRGHVWGYPRRWRAPAPQTDPPHITLGLPGVLSHNP